jgi:leucyl aminopeptidase
MAAPATLPPQVTAPELALSSIRLDAVPDVDVVALPVWKDADNVLLGPGAEALAERIGVDLLGVLESEAPGGSPGEAGEVTRVPVPSGTATNPDLRLVLLVGIGAGSAQDFRRAGAALARATRDRTAVATSIPAADPDAALEPFVVGTILGSFVFHWRSTPPEHPPAKRFLLAGFADRDARGLKEPFDRARAVARATWRARTMASVPSNLKNPDWLAQQARALADETGLDVEVWDEARLAADGFGGILGVGQASVSPPRLIRLDYRPPRRLSKRSSRGATVVLVGKGITFDTGGLSIKPGESMVNMKRDMTGGAVVMATMAALAEVGCGLRVVGLVAAAENSVSGNSIRPGDVLRHYGGRTTEVTNTDAEGRLVMADAIAYAVANLEPAVIVDVATLTGAIKVALGQQVGGLFANDEALAAALLDAGAAVGEPLWRFPLAEAYEEKLASKVADADNAGGGPGAITAALFLQHFAGTVPWAHLDIASTGDAPKDSYEWSQGPTGFGARALLHWLGGPDPLAGVGVDPSLTF